MLYKKEFPYTQLYQAYIRARVAIHTADAIVLVLVPALFILGALVGASASVLFVKYLAGSSMRRTAETR